MYLLYSETIWMFDSKPNGTNGFNSSILEGFLRKISGKIPCKTHKRDNIFLEKLALEGSKIFLL